LLRFISRYIPNDFLINAKIAESVDLSCPPYRAKEF
jgi:hypothetical protein